MSSPPDEKARNLAYYQARTVRDSSLSAAPQAVLAAEVGHLDLAYDLFAESVLQDLADLGDKTADGVATWPRWPARGWRWCRASVGCATTAGCSPSTPGCRDGSTGWRSACAGAATGCGSR